MLISLWYDVIQLGERSDRKLQSKIYLLTYFLHQQTERTLYCL